MASKFLLDTITHYIMDVYDVSKDEAERAINGAHSLDLGGIHEWIKENTDWGKEWKR